MLDLLGVRERSMAIDRGAFLIAGDVQADRQIACT